MSSPDNAGRLLERYGNDPDILELISENSLLTERMVIMSKKFYSYREQLKGLHKFIEAAKIKELGLK